MTSSYYRVEFIGKFLFDNGSFMSSQKFDTEWEAYDYGKITTDDWNDDETDPVEWSFRVLKG